MLFRQDQRQGQSIVQRIDPKLIMASAILQQSSLELDQFIQAEMADNPALETVEDQAVCSGNCVDAQNCPYCSQRLSQNSSEDRSIDFSEIDEDFSIASPYEGDEDYDPLNNVEAEVTLEEHLLKMAHTILPPAEQHIGEYLICNLNENGWLEGSLHEIAEDLNEPLETVERVLAVIQSLDPPGIGARDLRECLLIQLRAMSDDGCGHPLAQKMVETQFQDVVNSKHVRIARALGVPTAAVREALSFMQKHLTPYPAGQFRTPWDYKPTDPRGEIRPDVIIRRTKIGYEIDIPGTETYSLGINPTYREAYNTIKNGANGHIPVEDRKHIMEYVERAETFIKNVKQRRKTLRLITKCIIDCQQGFLETGMKSYIRPLTRTRLADMVKLHESTVSRATSRKFVQLPNQDVIPFDLFFDQAMDTKAAIEEIIAHEDPANPYSDRAIVQILRERGVEIARRTVVKYRDSQKLLSSSKRYPKSTL